MFYCVLKYLKLFGRFKRFCCYNDHKKTNCNSDISEIKPKTIISWNIQGLFCYTTPLRVKNIIRELRIFNSDILCLQEVFEDHIKSKIINDLKDIYPYYILGKTKKKYLVGEDSGLLILSKYIINFKKEILIDECVLPDVLCEKTIIYFSVGCINFSTAHLQSNNYKIAEKQIKEIINRAPFNKIIITGDLNHENANEILNVEKNNHKNTCEDTILDYILPINYKDLKLNVNTISMDLTDITDHLPVSAKIL